MAWWRETTASVKVSWRKLPAGRVRHSGTPTISHLNSEFSPTPFSLVSFQPPSRPPRNERPERSKIMLTQIFVHSLTVISTNGDRSPGLPQHRLFHAAQDIGRARHVNLHLQRNSLETEFPIGIPAPGNIWPLSILDLPYYSEYRMLPYLGQSPVLPEHLQVRLLHYSILHIHEGLQNGKMETFSVSGKLHTHGHPPRNSLTLTIPPLTFQITRLPAPASGSASSPRTA